MNQSDKEFPSDLSKGLGEWALAAGRKLQSPQTGYVHYYYGEASNGYHTIPIVENLLFALALLRTRLVEQIQEGKVLLQGLLSFQNLDNGPFHGNFPVYLHDYPHCKDPAIALHVLAPFYWILKHFGHVLGSQLKARLEQAACLAMEYCMELNKGKPFPYFLAVRFYAAQISFGIFLNRPEWESEGKEGIEKLAPRQLEGWQTTSQLGHILAGLQMIYPSLINSPWKPLWERMEQTWHSRTGTYIGPYTREWEEGSEPKTNLYDLFGGYFAHSFSERAARLNPNHLQGSLIQPTADRFSMTPPFIVNGENWQSICNLENAFTLLEKKEFLNPSVEKTFTPFHYIWGDIHRVHSFVCQGGSFDKAAGREEAGVIFITFDLKDRSPLEEHAQQREIEFFVDFHPESSFFTNGIAATTFQLGQTISMDSGAQTISLVFDLLEGEGDFIGHVMKGNRPSQTLSKGDNRFEAYDWTIFLRTIRRKTPCRIQAKLMFSVKCG